MGCQVLGDIGNLGIRYRQQVKVRGSKFAQGVDGAAGPEEGGGCLSAGARSAVDILNLDNLVTMQQSCQRLADTAGADQVEGFWWRVYHCAPGKCGR